MQRRQPAAYFAISNTYTSKPLLVNCPDVSEVTQQREQKAVKTLQREILSVAKYRLFFKCCLNIMNSPSQAFEATISQAVALGEGEPLQGPQTGSEGLYSCV